AKRKAGATLNDVCLTAVAGALRELALMRGEELRPLRVMVPVSVRDAAERQDLGNRISFAFIELPLAVPLAPPAPAIDHRSDLELQGLGAPSRHRHPAGGDRAAARPAQGSRRAVRLERTRLQPHDLEHPRTAIPAVPARRRAE